MSINSKIIRDKNMKKQLIGIMLVGFANFTYGANWQMINDGIEVELSKTTDRITWVRFINTPPIQSKSPNSYGQLIYSSVFKYEYSCNRQAVRELVSYNYGQNGNIVNSYTIPATNFQEVVPGSKGETLINYLCSGDNTQSYIPPQSIPEYNSEPVTNKSCEQIPKDFAYFSQIQKICSSELDGFNHKLTVDNFVRVMAAQGCPKMSNRQVNKLMDTALKAIQKGAAKSESLIAFCVKEQGYYNKVLTKYSSSSSM